MESSVAPRRNRIAALTVVVLAALVVGGPSAEAAVEQKGTITTKASTRAIAECTAPVTRPRSIVLACADGNAGLTAIRWTSWTATRATGSATYEYNDCEPYCAAGTVHRVKATFVLHAVVRTAKYGRLFSAVTVRWAGKQQEYALPTSLLSDVQP